MNEAPRAVRAHIALMGRSNAGKSALLNALCRQSVAIVSQVPGTTTDPIEKTMELSGIGPVVLLDTAGIDDAGQLGGQRKAASLRALRRMDAVLLVLDGLKWGEPEKELQTLCARLAIPCLVVVQKSESLAESSPLAQKELEARAEILKKEHDLGETPVFVSAKAGLGLEELITALCNLLRKNADPDKPLFKDLLPAAGLALLVVPIDTGAPKGRLILPQVQAIRDLLDGSQSALVSNVQHYPDALARLRKPPDLVVCDSQVVQEVVEATPREIPLTTFSILMARLKGDLNALAAGLGAIRKLRPGDRVLIQEACSHHPQKDDIGRIKLPRLLCQIAGGALEIDFAAGKEFSAYSRDYKAVIHCGGCMITARQMRARQREAEEYALPMTNYGLCISLVKGVLERVLEPFPQALALYAGAART